MGVVCALITECSHDNAVYTTEFSLVWTHDEMSYLIYGQLHVVR